MKIDLEKELLIISREEIMQIVEDHVRRLFNFTINGSPCNSCDSYGMDTIEIPIDTAQFTKE